ncbi:uncharacterized protein LOC112686605 [Sipha flava]|uniref:Uncharacterized protein LOC112686605 n=1 Tax=Sipha flava TaxID=143950 RepID=A0A8B8FWN6_9HEMI|nr:uncharacterized protein LOC112686605 [Sipha flava]
MPRNVEIKARINDLKAAKQRISNLKSNTSEDIDVIINQEDTFYNLPAGNKGKLKFRKIQGSDSELIFYEREEITGPKLSDFHRCKVPDDIKEFLSTTLGTWGIVKKVRNLIMIGQTRVHFDSVEGLGDFVELEVVLDDKQTVEDGQKIASNLMSHLQIEEKDLISVSYINMLCQNKSQ